MALTDEQGAKLARALRVNGHNPAREILDYLFFYVCEADGEDRYATAENLIDEAHLLRDEAEEQNSEYLTKAWASARERRARADAVNAELRANVAALASGTHPSQQAAE